LKGVAEAQERWRYIVGAWGSLKQFEGPQSSEAWGKLVQARNGQQPWEVDH